MPKSKSPDIQPPAAPAAAPPTPGPIDTRVAGEDIKKRQAAAKGRKASIATTPGSLAISDVDILKKTLG